MGSKEIVEGEHATLQAAIRYAWRYVGSLHGNTTEEDIKDYLATNGIQGSIICDKLNSQGMNKSFKIGIAEEEAVRVDEGSFWPKGIVIRPFRFGGWSRHNGVELYRRQ